jgi:hypothetical protein
VDPFLRHLTQRMENRGGGAEAQRPLMIDLFFAHDSTLLPVVALLDLVRVRAEKGTRAIG